MRQRPIAGRSCGRLDSPMRLIALTLVLGAAAHMGAAPVEGQVAAAQVSPADSAAVLLGVAEQFLSEGRTEAADAVLRFLLDHFAVTPSAEAARQALTSLTQSTEAGAGRVELQVWSAGFGLWLGVAVPAAFGAEGSEAYGVGLLLGGPIGFLAGSRLATSRRPSAGQARAITLGGTWGTWQGWGWSEVADWGTREVCTSDFCFEEGDSDRLMTGAILGGLVGIGVGTALSGREVSPGLATTVNFGALWGTWFGFAGGMLLDLEDDALLASTLLGGDAGLVGSALAHPSWGLTRNRARLISIAGVIGGLAGAGLDLLIQPEGERAAIAIPLGTSIVGLAVGAARTRGTDGSANPSENGALGDAPDLGALLQRDRGDWRVGIPLPSPIRVDASSAGSVRATAMHLLLLRARF